MSAEDDTVAERRGRSRENDRKDDESEVLHVDKIRERKQFPKVLKIEKKRMKQGSTCSKN